MNITVKLGTTGIIPKNENINGEMVDIMSQIYTSELRTNSTTQ